ncbi:exopolyphosphatase / guanosine-5'-triphosphate,3'-diphosphate pyrophosphatase [Nakamurella panacisegetis]|uniref:Exopolyphosphatase / guanosine-5'-triphosphate,3'-diphosphate pyrophosphatase n=1 Tax=Nakamurella panacisegetis TaxID=1090615 RepID=A0A1H0IGU8_9ACTN|nr:Ppx/GppA phosphatase family protein [Nakamurella panacisegetis]SDO30566.1 exopolyphosphatase / guanosine-5'-triphosphate,3'-diphosphate pyrophosphatase [Nakamurella panacisegetis]
MGKHSATADPGSSRRVAAIDCGTNSIRLLVADLTVVDGAVRLTDVHREMRVVRLGEGVDATGRLSPAAIDRTWSALAAYTAILRAEGAVQVRMAATSATRDADNRADFVAMVTSTLGQEPEVITGAEEAALSFRGAVGDLDPSTGPFLVVDIGGGSTEMVVGSVVDGRIVIAGEVSLDIGCVRITERVLRGDPPTAAERREAEKWARAVLGDGLDQLPVRSVRRLVPVSGTATTVAAAALRLPTYDPDRIHLAHIPASRVHQVADTLLGATRAHRAALGYMHPGRVDVIGGGALVLSTLVSLVRERVAPGAVEEITVSEHDILDGLALSLA